jgi:predicted Zn-dependent peptidase
VTDSDDLPRITRLANGLTVALQPMSGVETLAVGLYADCGSRHEDARLNGIAHMMEHMVFKGAGSRSARAIAEAVEDVGGSINAYTARDHTVFHARLLPGDLALGVDLIADLVRTPRLDPAELEREKAVILQELGEARDTPDDIIFDHLQLAAFPAQALGRPVLGDEMSIAAADVSDLRLWIDTHYRPETLVLAAAGKVDEDALLKLAEARFGDLAGASRSAAEPARYAGGRMVDDRKFEQAHLTMAFEGVSYTAADQYALGLFASAAGGGMSSRLFQELREERGLAYSVYAYHSPYADTGLFGVYLATARKEAAQAQALARQVLETTAAELQPAELDRAKAQAKAGLLMGLESVQARCDHLARQLMIYGRPVEAAEIVAEIDNCSLDQVRGVAARMLSGPMAIATVGHKLAKAA